MDFGFLFSRVCFHYGFSYRELMRLPMKTFWMLNHNISRLLAEKDMRALNVAAASAQGVESAKSAQEALANEMGEPYKLDHVALAEAERDEDGFNELRRMAKGG